MAIATLFPCYSLLTTAFRCLPCLSFRRPQTCYELIADLWNSPDFNPVAPPSRCHSDFVSETDCSHAAVVGLAPATAVKVADLITSMRCKLLTIIKNWEASGQGDGGMDREEDDAEVQDVNEEQDEDEAVPTFGSLTQRPARALDSRAAFLRGMPSYLLYYWEIADSQQLLASCLQRLSEQASACNASSVGLVSRSVRSTPSGSRSSASRASRRSTPRNEESNDEFSTSSVENPLLQSLQELVDSQRSLLTDRALDREHQERENTRKRRFDRRSFLVDEARSFRIKIAECSCNDDDRSRRMLQFYNSEVAKLEEEIRELNDIGI